MFYDIFVQLCKSKGVTVSRAALDVGLSKSAPIAWRKKGFRPSGDTLEKLADYFGVSIDYLLTGEEQAETKKSPSNYEEEEDVSVLLDIIKDKLKDAGPISFDGKIVTAEDARLLLNSLETIEEMAKRMAKERDEKE